MPSNSHLHVERDAQYLVLLHLKVHSYGRLVVPFKYVTTIPGKWERIRVGQWEKTWAGLKVGKGGRNEL